MVDFSEFNKMFKKVEKWINITVTTGLVGFVLSSQKNLIR